MPLDGPTVETNRVRAMPLVSVDVVQSRSHTLATVEVQMPAVGVVNGDESRDCGGRGTG